MYKRQTRTYALGKIPQIMKDHFTIVAISNLQPVSYTHLPMPVDYDELLGKVALSVPFLGRILATVATTSGKAAAACLIGVAVIFHIIAGRLRVDDEY